MISAKDLLSNIEQSVIGARTAAHPEVNDAAVQGLVKHVQGSLDAKLKDAARAYVTASVEAELCGGAAPKAKISARLTLNHAELDQHVGRGVKDERPRPEVDDFLKRAGVNDFNRRLMVNNGAPAALDLLTLRAAVAQLRAQLTRAGYAVDVQIAKANNLLTMVIEVSIDVVLPEGPLP